MPVGAAGLPPAGWRAAEQAAIILANRSVVQADLYIGAIVVLRKTRAHPQASIGPPRERVSSLGPTPGATTPEKSYELSSTTTGLLPGRSGATPCSASTSTDFALVAARTYVGSQVSSVETAQS